MKKERVLVELQAVAIEEELLICMAVVCLDGSRLTIKAAHPLDKRASPQLLVLQPFVVAQFLVLLRHRLERAAQPHQLRMLQLRARQRRRLRRLALLPLARLSEQIRLWRR